MERITYRISLDTQKNGVQKILQGFNVGDQVARRIEIALTAGGNTIDLPDTGVTALMYVTVDGIASVNAVTIEDGRAFYDVDANDTATAGMVMMNLKVLDTTTGMVLYAPQFQLEVWENGIGSSSAATSPTFTALESALAQAQLYSQRTIKSVYIDDDTDIFTVEYMDGSVYTSSVIADAVAKIGDVEQYVQRAETAAQNAFESETTARTSEINAVASATQAALSETYAEQYKDTALTAAQSATASENAAAASENKALCLSRRRQDMRQTLRPTRQLRRLQKQMHSHPSLTHTHTSRTQEHLRQMRLYPSRRQQPRQVTCSHTQPRQNPTPLVVREHEQTKTTTMQNITKKSVNRLQAECRADLSRWAQ